MAISSRIGCDVAVIGDIYLDHVFSGFAAWPGPGEEIFTDAYTAELGGGAVATACALARLGRSVRLIGAVGRTEFATIERRLSEFGIQSDLLLRSDDRTGISVSISTAHERTFFTYRGANRELQQHLTTDASLISSAASARHVHMALPLALHDAPDVLRWLRAQGASISLDVGHQVEWLTARESRDILRNVDLFLPNEMEAGILAGGTAEYLQMCQDAGIRTAVVKLGGAGAIMRVAGETIRAQAPTAQVVDTTGAGDAFNAGLLDGLLDGLPPEAMLQHACVCGTLSTMAAGALASLPTRTQAEQFSRKMYVA